MSQKSTDKIRLMRSSELIWQDTQHQVLFKLIDEIAADDCNADVIHKLKLYADHHFYLEEAYMEKLAYPKREHHVAAHNRFRKELHSLEQDFIEFGLTQAVRETISNFLSEWLTRHIMGVDKDFENFVMQSDSK